MIYYLYIKTHNQTGLKYLGITKREDYDVYKGSGKRWIRHIKKHGYDVTTEIIVKCESEEELQVCGTFWSKVFNVVESKEWANLIEENGNIPPLLLGPKTEEQIKKIVATRKANGSYTHSEKSKEKNRQKHLGKIPWNKGIPMREESKEKLSKTQINRLRGLFNS